MVQVNDFYPVKRTITREYDKDGRLGGSMEERDEANIQVITVLRRAIRDGPAGIVNSVRAAGKG
jgi:hypothetical protein